MTLRGGARRARTPDAAGFRVGKFV
jgi:hypothetical protein